ncbi:MAG TPA: hypothetical protein VFR85_05350 [Anaeromyxobacteraceae bacterium]|nr:hypothetical protein [Anaeromyxobacteraceae bacterium]
MRRLAPILLLALAAQACSDLEVPPPVLQSVQPDAVPNASDAVLAVLGQDFYAEVTVDFDDPSQSSVNVAFSLELVHPNGRRFPLSGVTLVSSGELEGTLAASAPAQTYSLSLVDPRGRTATLPAALQVYKGDCISNPPDCETGNPCTVNDYCQGHRCREGTPLPDGTPCQLICQSATPVEICLGGVCTPPLAGCP